MTQIDLLHCVCTCSYNVCM